MFSRRHPYLFFLLCMASLMAGVVILSSLMIASGMKAAGLGRLVDGDGSLVGVVEIFGPISSSDDILDQIRKFREDDSVSAIVLRIDSPGGAVGPSQEIYQEVRKTIKVKKVVASMGSIAASGGYYIAAAADKILANPGTITGSIGVILGYTNFRELLSKIGLTPVVIKSGKYKDIGSPLREMTGEEEKFLQDFSDEIHRQFISDVAVGRKLERDVVAAIADGRIMTGEKARSLGLVDEMGNLEDAVEVAGRLAGVEGKVIKVYPLEKRLSWFRYVTGSSPREILNQIMHTELFAGYMYAPGDMK
ncbi:MAG: signal peptide peptidase SppA [Proteobacteria bacterium]|nr:signal peptide peptidase SppA [Pseudomonadota bacterium]MBU4469550.1 signal peptide peptidase SppA [Pseudomonadota bacterium]MCG2753228.1 signal peptide peptidase SppA [Desulfobacteraceae bacterium]